MHIEESNCSIKSNYKSGNCFKRISKKCWKNRRYGVISSAILIIICAIIIIVLCHLRKSEIYPYNYAVILDAGTTGTRAYLYQWPSDKSLKAFKLTEKNKCKFDSLTKLDLTAKTNEFRNCISILKNSIPKEYKEIPNIYLCATAGMRILQKDDPVSTDSKFETSSVIINELGFKVRHSGTITGQEEGASSWIAANFMKQTIDGIGDKSVDTYGIMEIGGGSYQITYQDSQAGNYTVKVFGRDYKLYSRSYLCYGADMFYLRYLTYIINTKSEIEFNCLLKDTPLKVNFQSSFCQYDNKQILTEFNTTKKLKPDGNGCSAQVKRMIDTVIVGTKLKHRIMAFSVFYYYNNFLKTYYNYTDGSDLAVVTNKFCSVIYSDLSTKFSDVKNYAYQYCLIGHYIIEIFHRFNLKPSNSYGNIEYVRKINGNKIDWNYGYMLQKTSESKQSITYNIPIHTFIIILTLTSSVILLLFLWLLYVACHEYRHNFAKPNHI